MFHMDIELKRESRRRGAMDGLDRGALPPSTNSRLEGEKPGARGKLPGLGLGLGEGRWSIGEPRGWREVRRWISRICEFVRSWRVTEFLQLPRWSARYRLSAFW